LVLEKLNEQGTEKLIKQTMEGQPFTPEEALEYQCLKSLLLNGNMFVVFTPEEENSKEYKRYDELNKKKLNWFRKNFA